MLPEIGSGVARENQRRSPSWASPTTVGGATRPIPSPSGELRRRSGWLRSSRPWLLPIPRGARKSPAAEHLQAAHQPAVASGTRTPQSACPQKVGGSHSVVRTVDTAPESPAPLSSSSLLRHSSFIRAECVNALVRICAGGDQRWSSLLRQPDALLFNGKLGLKRVTAGDIGLRIPCPTSFELIQNTPPGVLLNPESNWMASLT